MIMIYISTILHCKCIQYTIYKYLDISIYPSKVFIYLLSITLFRCNLFLSIMCFRVNNIFNLSLYQSIYPSIYLSMYLSMYLSTNVFIHLPMYLSIYQANNLSFYSSMALFDGYDFCIIRHCIVSYIIRSEI